MIEAGQFLSQPGSLLAFLAGFGIFGVGMLLWTLTMLRSQYAVKLVPTLGKDGYFKGIGFAAMISIGLTLVLQMASLVFLDTAVRVTNVRPNEVVGLNGLTEKVKQSDIHAGPALHMGRAASNWRVIAALVVIALLLVIGAGYAFTALDLSFLGHFAAFSAGVGLVEEFSKALAGLAILYLIVPKGSNLSPKGFERRVLGSFGIAGLGFGAGEALHYFGTYSTMESGLGIYAVRAVWCVTLHGAWTLIVGRLLLHYPDFPKDRADIESEMIATGKGKAMCGWSLLILIACVPTILLHAFYNACCLHESGFCWVTGIVSIIIAATIIDASSDAPVPKPAS